MAVTRKSRFRVCIYGHDANRGPGELLAIVDDPKQLGVSEHANDVGEMFFTVPHTHRAVGELVPLERHYEVLRSNGATFITVGRGILDDFEATSDEVTAFGHDYKGLLHTSITSSSTTYTNASLGTVVSDQLTSAISEADSRLAFTSIGTIDATSVTATLLSAFESRLDFIGSIAEISMSDRSVRTILSIPRNPPYAWTFEENRGQDRGDLRLEYGGLVSDFLFLPNYANFATQINGIGIKREGASILYSTQTYASTSTYGHIARPMLHQNVVDQDALDRIVARDARRAGTAESNVSLIIRSGRLAPWITWEIGDSVYVKISRGQLVDINTLYTIWGFEWIVAPNGKEQLFLLLSKKET